jgi:hypothetical protein
VCKERHTRLSISVCRLFRNIVETVVFIHILARMVLDRIVSIVALDIFGDLHTIVAFVDPLVAMMTSLLVMWR